MNNSKPHYSKSKKKPKVSQVSLRHLSFLIPVIVGICRHAYLKTYMYLYFSADLGMGSRSVYIGIRVSYGCHTGGIWAVYDGIRMVSGCINAGGNRWYRVVYGWYAGGIRVVYGTRYKI